MTTLAKLIASPARARLYYGHLYDIITTAYNRDYLRHFSDQLGALLPAQDFAGHLDFAVARADWALNRAPDAGAHPLPPVDFAIETGGGAPLSVTTPTVTLEGSGWIDVHRVWGPDPSAPLTLTWTTETSWQRRSRSPAARTRSSCEPWIGASSPSQRHALITRSGSGCP
jgi:hypothetical protein